MVDKRNGIRSYSILIFFICAISIAMFIPNIKTIAANKILKIHYIDVGQADCILIQNNGSNMLIDAGNREDGKSVVYYLKKQGVKKLDYIIGTHPHEDHIGGMSAVLKAFSTKKLIMPRVTSNTKTFMDLLLLVKSKNMKITTPIVGNSFKVGDAVCTIMAPNGGDYEDLNNYSVVIRMTFGSNAFMFEGDAEAISEKEILTKGLNVRADVLKLGHHGSSSSSTEAYLDKVKPEYAIISCGKNNDYGHPHKETLDKLIERNIKYYRTDINGSIVCTSDGKNISFTTTRTSEAFGGRPLTKYNSKDLVVYISKSGKKYHLANCKTLKNSKIPIKLNLAKTKGYLPCKICNPPK